MQKLICKTYNKKHSLYPPYSTVGTNAVVVPVLLYNLIKKTDIVNLMDEEGKNIQI